MDSIGLVAAMPLESNALLRLVRTDERIRLDSYRAARFRILEHDCTLITSGMGPTRALAATRMLIETAHPACLISFGIAGAVREDIQIGDVIMASQNYLLDEGLLVNPRYLALPADSIRGIIEKGLGSRQVRFRLGTAITTAGTQTVLDAPSLPNPVLEMETAGILQAAGYSKTPVVAIRAISDGPSEPIPFDLAAITNKESQLLPGRLLLECIRHPQILLQSGRMLKNSRIAAVNAAVAVYELLRCPAWPD